MTILDVYGRLKTSMDKNGQKWTKIDKNRRQKTVNRP